MVKQLDSSHFWFADLQRSAAILYDAGAHSVWLFGSQSRGDPTDRLSDFDFAVEGMPNNVEAMARAKRELRGKVDIVRMEDAPPPLRWCILSERTLVPRSQTAHLEPRQKPPLPTSLAGLRIRAAVRLLREHRVRSVIDFGCGHGWLLAELGADPAMERLTGVDMSTAAIAAARLRLARTLGPSWSTRVDLVEGLITSREAAFRGYAAATAIEVIEHLGEPQLDAFLNVLFGWVRPRLAILTTPNADYNVTWSLRLPNRRRHHDHRFELTREEFSAWTSGIAGAFGYSVSLHPVGTEHLLWGPPTQLAVFVGQP